MASSRMFSRRVLLYNALLSSALASLALLTLILLGFMVMRNKFTSDTYGRCLVCRYQVLVKLESRLWKSSVFSDYIILPILGALTIYAVASGEVLLRNEARLARSNGKRLALLLRPFTGETDLRITRNRWGLKFLLLAGIQSYAIVQLMIVRSVEDKLPAGISHPLSLLNDTFKYGEIGDNITSSELDPWQLTSLHIANPFISYSQLYPNDTINIPDSWANTSLYLPASSLPPLESQLYDSASAHTSRLGAWRPGSFEKTTNLTRTRGGFPIGDAVYSKMATEGLGINMTSYEKFTGDGGAGLPRDFEFQVLFGESWVTDVKVSCRRFWTYDLMWEDSPDHGAHNVSLAEKQPSAGEDRDGMIMTFGSKQYRFRRPPNNDLQVFTDFDLISFDDTLGDTTPSRTDRQQLSGQLAVQTIIIPEWTARQPLATFYKCSYMPSEFHKAYMAFPNMPIRDYYATVNNDSVWQKSGEPLSPAKSLLDDLNGKCLSPIYALPAARAIHGLLSQGETGSGGPLGLALRKLGLSMAQKQSKNLQAFLENVLSETAQAYFSLLRQRVERANAWPTQEQLLYPNKKIKMLFFKIRRIGGASALAGPGLCIIAVIFLATGTTFLRSLATGIAPLLCNSVYERIPSTDMADEKAAVEKKHETTTELSTTS